MSGDDLACNDVVIASNGSQAATSTFRRQELDAFFREFHGKLLSLVYTRVHSWAEAKDVVQEAYCRIFDSDGTRTIGRLRGYLYRTALNIAEDRQRARKVREGHVSRESLVADRQCVSTEHVWLVREELECVQRAIDSLPPKARLALRLIRYEGYNYEEAAARLGIKPLSVRKLLERALEFVRQRLELEGHAPRRPR